MKKDLNEHDTVFTNCTIPEIPEGSVGTIIYIYKYYPACEVEFIIQDKLIVKTLHVKQLNLKTT
jgi:hypothetical protein